MSARKHSLSLTHSSEGLALSIFRRGMEKTRLRDKKKDEVMFFSN